MKTQILKADHADSFVTKALVVQEGPLDPGDAKLGESFGRCVIERFLGAGGAGSVYQARHLELDSKRAIKVLRQGSAIDAKSQERFVREAKTAAGLNHPNIVQVHHAGAENGKWYIEMELVEGKSLRRLLQERALAPIDVAVGIVYQVSQALAQAALQGVVHRDVKPENILVRPDGLVKLTDFGIARSTERGQNTLTGTIMGTCGYMSLEQMHGLPLDSRTDVYSLTVVLYEMVTGELPFKGETLTAIIKSILSNDFKPLQKTGRTVSSALSKLVAKGLQPKAADRFDHINALVASLRECGLVVDGAASQERIADWMAGRLVAQTTKGSKRKKLLPALCGIAVLAMLAALAFKPTPASKVEPNRSPVLRVSAPPPLAPKAIQPSEVPPVEPIKPKPQVTEKRIKPITAVAVEVPKESAVAAPEPVNEPLFKTEFSRLEGIESRYFAGETALKTAALDGWKGYIKQFSVVPEASEQVRSAKGRLLQLLK